MPAVSRNSKLSSKLTNLKCEYSVLGSTANLSTVLSIILKYIFENKEL